MSHGATLGAGLSIVALACATPGPMPVGETRPVELAPLRVDGAPDDPIFVPPSPTGDAHTGGMAAARTRGDIDQARQLVRQISEGLRDSDRPAIEDAFVEPVLRVRAGRYILRERLVAQCLQSAAPLGWHPELELSQLVDLERIDVVRLGSPRHLQALPAGLDDNDLRVEVRLHRAPGRGRGSPATTLPCLSLIYVRGGAQPRVIAID